LVIPLLKLKVTVDFAYLVDWNERHGDSRGRSATDKSPKRLGVPETEINNLN